SPPEQNPRPLPVIITARASRQDSSERKVLASSPYTSKVRALRRSGRHSVMAATPREMSSSKDRGERVILSSRLTAPRARASRGRRGGPARGEARRFLAAQGGSHFVEEVDERRDFGLREAGEDLLHLRGVAALGLAEGALALRRHVDAPGAAI